jgi:cobalt-precorrin 5A hydrolase
MTTGDAIGVGCRIGTPAAAIEDLVRHALAIVPDVRPGSMFTIADKAGEPGLAEAARHLSLRLVYLSREALRGQQAAIATPSRHAEQRFGVASVAEAAALAGAGSGSVLIVQRLARDGVTCAIARHRPSSA